jgi:hypothetical protein
MGSQGLRSTLLGALSRGLPFRPDEPIVRPPFPEGRKEISHPMIDEESMDIRALHKQDLTYADIGQYPLWGYLDHFRRSLLKSPPARRPGP